MPPAATQDKKNNNSSSSSGNTYQRLSSAPGRLGVSMAASETSSLPPAVRVRLYELFVQIEREFEMLHAENASLQERIDRLQQQKSQQQLRQSLSQPHYYQPYGSHQVPSSTSGGSLVHTDMGEGDNVSGQVKFQQVSAAPSGGHRTGLYAHKIKSHTNKLRAQTNRLMSNFKGQALNCQPVRRYVGHKDGIWEVTVSRMGLPLLGTASADHTAMVWGMHSGSALLQYAGHQGSVNSIRYGDLTAKNFPLFLT